MKRAFLRSGTWHSIRRPVEIGGFVILGFAALIGAAKTAHGDGVDAEKQAKQERCAIRLSSAILGESPKPELMALADPQSQVDAMLEAPAFIEHFASSLNAMLNRGPGSADKPGEDAVYFVSKHVLEKGRPWSDVFAGPFNVAENGTVTDDPNGLGYFRSAVWMNNNSGAETSGLRLATAARMLRHTIGLEMVGKSNDENASEAERTAEGRKRAACASCHYDSWFALDKLAAALSRRQGGAGTPMTFFDPPEGYKPQQVLDGTVTNDKDIVTRLVTSTNFDFNACRTAFHFLYGREENTCDGVLFDKCVDAFKAKKTMQSALATIAKDPSFCE